MSTPSPITLAIAAALEGALTPIVQALTAPLVERIAKLEGTREDYADALLGSSKFDDAVVNVIADRSSDVFANIEDEVKECVEDRLGSEVDDKVSEVIRNGSFNIEFSRF